MPLIVCGVGAKCMAANAISLAEWHMQLHTDYSLRVVVRPEDVAWSASPEPGVDRRRLERDGDEVARATSIVRYAPGSRFAAHTHGGGEEILVLEGVFSDEHGDYPAGTYLRNPIGTRHTPFSEPGTTLLVKLRQFDAADTTTLRLNTQSIPAQAGAAAGVTVYPLHQHGSEIVRLLRFAPGASTTVSVGSGGEEILVLEGQLSDPFGDYPAGTWLRNPAGGVYTRYTAQGCLLYTKVGHLPQP